ncbi:MAG TPA: DUF2726 domain-containing protein, partial [Fimbriimonadaceae bacterium]|nr:DUF2726 domain-containing protein [Fimbriimonadaceae bacterium]
MSWWPFKSKEQDLPNATAPLGYWPGAPQIPLPFQIEDLEPVVELPRHRYTVEPRLLTRTEAAFFAVLEQACPPGFRVFSKVRVSDILKAETGYGSHLHMSKKHVDFVIVCATTYRPVMAIELDDYTHSYKSQRKRDEAKDRAFETAGMKLYRIPVAPSYDVEAFRRSLWKKLV